MKWGLACHLLTLTCLPVPTLAAAFAPNPVIVRLSDFKSNEYANLLGGRQFEPEEENPMIGFRGTSRYLSEEFRESFERNVNLFVDDAFIGSPLSPCLF